MIAFADNMAERFKRPGFGVATVLLVVLASVWFAVATGRGRVEASNGASVRPVEVRELRFFDLSDGGVNIVDAEDGSLVARIEPGTNGFLRSTVRGLVRERKRRDIGAQMPFELALSQEGQLTLADPATGRAVDLRAFGSTNLEVFARLLPVHSGAATVAASSIAR